ncbi:heterokaryon incompatibility protein-domain-containing protein [Xylaria digitata]|nr:heterokaryon incompatibility protein-domain-containing protein [Xylaria digitata]
MVFCNSCQDLTFDPVNEDSLDDFEAVVHEDLISLEECAKSRACHLCGNPNSLYNGKNRVDVSLGIYYKPESSDEWIFLDEECGLEDSDAPEYMISRHTNFQHSFRICNPKAISRSSWSLNQNDSRVQLAELEVTSTGLGESDTSTGSSESAARIELWIEKRRNEYQACRQKSSDSTFIYPTRLLDVSNALGDSGFVTLVSSVQSDLQHGRPLYATVSRRWRPGTTCEMTREYDDEKALEIPKMADYYQNAEFNLSAATEHNEGLWSERDGDAIGPFNIQITINTPSIPRETRETVVRISPILRGDKSHLDHCGWILQERIFPRRTVFFDPYWVSFECSEMSTSESCPEGLGKSHDTSSSKFEDDMGTKIDRDVALSVMGGTLRNLSSGVSNRRLDDAARNAALQLWFDIVKEYSLRQLTSESDRLDAISALAARVSRILDDNQCRGAVLENFSARDATPLVRVMNVEWKTRGPNICGDLAEAKLTLSGRPLRSYCYFGKSDLDEWKELVAMTDALQELPRRKITDNEVYNTVRYGVDMWWLHICGEYRGEKVRITLAISPDASDSMAEGFIYFLPLADYLNSEAYDKLCGQPGRLFGLVLRETDNGTFERLGHAEIDSVFLMTGKERSMVLV